MRPLVAHTHTLAYPHAANFILVFWIVTSLPVLYVFLYICSSAGYRTSWHRGWLGFYLGRSTVYGISFIPSLRYMISILICEQRSSRFVLRADASFQCWTPLHIGAFMFAFFSLVCLIAKAIHELHATDILTHEISNPMRTALHIVFLRSKVVFFLTAVTCLCVYLDPYPAILLWLYLPLGLFPLVYFFVRLPLVRSGDVASIQPDLDPQEIERRCLLAAHEVPSLANDAMIGGLTALLWLVFVSLAEFHLPLRSAVPLYLLIATPLAFAIGFYLSFFRRAFAVRSVPSLSPLPAVGSEASFWRHPLHPDIVPVDVAAAQTKTVRLHSDAGALSFACWFHGNRVVRHLTILGRNPLVVPHAHATSPALSVAGLTALLPALASAPGLAALALTGHTFDERVAQAICDHLDSLAALVSLDLSANALGEAAVLRLARACAASRTLQRVNLSANRLSPEAAAGVRAVVAELQSSVAIDV